MTIECQAQARRVQEENLSGAASAVAKPELEVVCSVHLDRLEVMADIGMLAAEQGRRQPLILAIELTIAAPEQDDLDQTVDYRELLRAAQALADERIAPIETFARRLALYCLTNLKVLAANVRIDKPRAVPQAMAGAQVRISRGGGAQFGR